VSTNQLKIIAYLSVQISIPQFEHIRLVQIIAFYPLGHRQLTKIPRNPGKMDNLAQTKKKPILRPEISQYFLTSVMKAITYVDILTTYSCTKKTSHTSLNPLKGTKSFCLPRSKNIPNFHRRKSTFYNHMHEGNMGLP
jgi:hypothetical protein